MLLFRNCRGLDEADGNRYKIEVLMSRMRKLKGLVAASLRLKTINDNPLLKYGINI